MPLMLKLFRAWKSSELGTEIFSHALKLLIHKVCRLQLEL